jgi:hypothetical protein
MVTYADVQPIVSDLVAQGQHPSRKLVRRLLGDQGSFETIGKYIDRALTELGVTPAPEPARAGGYALPTPDSVKVAQHLEALRLETHLGMAADHLRTLLATLRCLAGPLQAATTALNRRHALSHAGIPWPSRPDAPHLAPTKRVQSQLEPMVTDVTRLLRAIEELETATGGIHGDHTVPAA